MTGWWMFFDLVVFGAGYAFCWFTKDAVIEVVMGTTGLIKKLEAKVDAIKKDLSNKS